MSDEIGTDRIGAPIIPPGRDGSSFPSWIFGICIAAFMIVFGFLLWLGISSSRGDSRRQSELDIKNCVDRGGQVITGRDNWFLKCVGGTP